MVKVLLSHGADVNSVSDTGSTPVRSACYIVRPGLHTRYSCYIVRPGLHTRYSCYIVIPGLHTRYAPAT